MYILHLLYLLQVLAAQGHVQTVTNDVGKALLAGDAALLPINSKG